MAQAVAHPSPFSRPGQTSYTFAEFAACAKDIAPAHAVLRQALDKPYLHPPIRSATATYPYAAFRELARELAGEAVYYEMNGQYGRAADTRLDGMEMAVMIPRGGSLLAGLVDRACEDIAESGFEPLLPKLSPAGLAHVAAKRVTFADMMQEDSYISTAELQEEMRDLSKQGLQSYRGVRILVGDADQSAWSKNWRVARYYLADKEAILRENLAYHQAVAAEARQP